MEIVQFAGLEIVLAKLSLQQGQNWTSTAPPGLWYSILLEGMIEVSEENFGRRMWSGGISFRHYSERRVEIEHAAPSSKNLLGVFLRIPPGEINSILELDGSSTREHGVFNAHIWNNEPIIASLAWQILGCPLNASARRLYLSGKALELLSFMSGGGEAVSRDAAQSYQPGRTHEIGRVYEARSRLLADLQNPPSVPELANAVGLNARRLGELFKIHFGTTVYAFLKTARFDRAKLLLESGGTNVSQVAYQYGYQPAHFSTEFKRRFGVSPAAISKRSTH